MALGTVRKSWGGNFYEARRNDKHLSLRVAGFKECFLRETQPGTYGRRRGTIVRRKVRTKTGVEIDNKSRAAAGFFTPPTRNPAQSVTTLWRPGGLKIRRSKIRRSEDLKIPRSEDPRSNNRRKGKSEEGDQPKEMQKEIYSCRNQQVLCTISRQCALNHVVEGRGKPWGQLIVWHILQRSLQYDAGENNRSMSPSSKRKRSGGCFLWRKSSGSRRET